MSGGDRAPATPADVLAFWRAAGPDKWFSKDAAFDAEIATRFLPTYEAAAAGRLAHWEATPEGALALLLVLDQFPRNMFRGSARTFAADPVARAVAERAIARGDDARVAMPERSSSICRSSIRRNPPTRSAASSSIAPAATPTA